MKRLASQCLALRLFPGLHPSPSLRPCVPAPRPHQAADPQGTKMAVRAIVRACADAGAWPALNDNILLISKRRSPLKQARAPRARVCAPVQVYPAEAGAHSARARLRPRV